MVVEPTFITEGVLCVRLHAKDFTHILLTFNYSLRAVLSLSPFYT